jgi:hypothetical protein
MSEIRNYHRLEKADVAFDAWLTITIYLLQKER